MLQAMKSEHETKVLEAVKQAIEDEATGSRTATSLVDTALRPATEATTGQGLAESLMISNPSDLLPGLFEAKSRLQRISQVGLDAMSQVLGVWLLHCWDHGNVATTSVTHRQWDPRYQSKRSRTESDKETINPGRSPWTSWSHPN
jgi:hypothetical protein